MKYNIGDLLVFSDSDVYVITEIKNEYRFPNEHTGTPDIQYTLLLLNPKNKLKLRKRYMLGQGIERALAEENPMWKHFAVIR
jgi:hypothetical protein